MPETDDDTSLEERRLEVALSLLTQALGPLTQATIENVKSYQLGMRSNEHRDDPALRGLTTPTGRPVFDPVAYAERMREMSPADFSELLRTATKQDEWLLLLHGAVLGFGGGLVHLALFG